MTTRTKLIYDDLKSRYKKQTISKAEYAKEIGQSMSAVDQRMKDALGVPPWKKHGSKKNSKVTFNLIDVAEYLADTIKVVA